MCPDDHFVPSHEKRACRIAIPVDGAEMLREPGIFQLWFFVLVVAFVLFGGAVVVVAAIVVVVVAAVAVAVAVLVPSSLGVRAAAIRGALTCRGYGVFLRRCRIGVAMRKGCCLGTWSRLCLRFLA